MNELSDPIAVAAAHICAKVKMVAAHENTFGVLSTGERIAVALVLERHDLLQLAGAPCSSPLTGSGRFGLTQPFARSVASGLSSATPAHRRSLTVFRQPRNQYPFVCCNRQPSRPHPARKHGFLTGQFCRFSRHR